LQFAIIEGFREVAPPFQQLKLSPSTMKKFVPSISILFDRCGGKRLSQLLVLFVVFALTPSTLLALEPVVGSWIVHVTVDKPSTAKFDNLSTFLAEGIDINSDPNGGDGYGVWKKMGPSTYFVKFVVNNPVVNNSEGTVTTISGPLILNREGNQLQGTFQGKVTDPTGNTVFAEFSGRTTLDRITFDSKP
jgi:hypothetical protein